MALHKLIRNATLNLTSAPLTGIGSKGVVYIFGNFIGAEILIHVKPSLAPDSAWGLLVYKNRWAIFKETVALQLDHFDNEMDLRMVLVGAPYDPERDVSVWVTI